MPGDWQLGEVNGVAVNSKGHIFIFERGNTQGPAYNATAAVLLEFDKDGKFIKEIGHNIYAWSYAHAVRIDKYDNIWAIDKGSDMVVKFNPRARSRCSSAASTRPRRRRTLDARDAAAPARRPAVPSADRRDLGPAGQHLRQRRLRELRVAKFDKDGVWVKSFGEPGSGPGQLNTVHTIAADNKGNIYVGDRSNQRVQVFDHDGTLLRQLKVMIPVPPDAHAAIGPTNLKADGGQGVGAPWAICITPGPTQYLYLADSFPGRIYKMTLDGQVVGWLGKNGKQPKEFGWIHEMACPSENELLVGELLNWRMSKLSLHPDKTTTSAAR